MEKIKCYACGAEMGRAEIEREFARNGKVAALQLNAWVCRACGEAAFGPEEVRRIEQALAEGAPEK